MAKSITRCSYRFMTKRDLTGLVATIGFIAAIPLLVFMIAETERAQQTSLKVELSANGRLLQVEHSPLVQIAALEPGEW